MYHKEYIKTDDMVKLIIYKIDDIIEWVRRFKADCEDYLFQKLS